MENSTREHELTTATWHKSSYSGGEGGNCLEVAPGHPTPALAPVRVRDSKTPLGPRLAFRAEAWSAFVENLKTG
jgi:hypothetical protein